MEEREIAGGAVGLLMAIIGSVWAFFKWTGRLDGSGNSPEGNRRYVYLAPEDQTRFDVIGQALVDMRESHRVDRAADLAWREAHQETTKDINQGIIDLGKEFAEIKGALQNRN